METKTGNGVPAAVAAQGPLFDNKAQPRAGPSAPVGCAAVKVHASLIDPPPGNREAHLDDVKDLIESIKEHGQLVEAIIYPSSADPKRYVAADGNRRVAAMRYLDMEVRARLLDRAPTPEGLIAVRLTIDSTRKAMDRAEVGANVWQWLEITGATQDAAAEAFRFSGGYVSKIIAPFKRGIAPLLQMLREGKISGTACALVAALTPEQQQKAVEDMAPIVARDGKVKRDAAERICARLRGKKERGPKAVKFSACGVVGTIRGEPLAVLRAFHSRLTDLFKRVEKDPALAALAVSLLR